MNSFYEIEHPSGKKKKVSQESDKAFLQLKRNKNAFKISILPCAVSFKSLEKIIKKTFSIFRTIFLVRYESAGRAKRDLG